MNVMWLGENECVWWIKMEVMVNVYSWFFLKNVKMTIRREMGIRLEASGIER